MKAEPPFSRPRCLAILVDEFCNIRFPLPSCVDIYPMLWSWEIDLKKKICVLLDLVSSWALFPFWHLEDFHLITRGFGCPCDHPILNYVASIYFHCSCSCRCFLSCYLILELVAVKLKIMYFMRLSLQFCTDDIINQSMLMLTFFTWSGHFSKSFWLIAQSLKLEINCQDSNT